MFNISELVPGVFSVEAYDSEACNKAVSVCENADGWKQAEISNYSHAKFVQNNIDLQLRNVVVMGPLDIPELAEEYKSFLLNKIMHHVENIWGIKNLKITGLQIAKYVSGSHIKPHHDTAVGSYARCVTALLYLNNEYEGGELLLPDFDFEYTPKAGELIFMPSEYLHAVKPVLSGVRYCFVAFFTSNIERAWQT
jgi:Rps23 Pro-64 3,4-dihydroxylase Tpa1-like proline 4-hydroxylase